MTTTIASVTEYLVMRGYEKVDPPPEPGVMFRCSDQASWVYLPTTESLDGWSHIWISELPQTLYALQLVFSPAGETAEVHVCNLLDGDQVATTDDLTGTLDDWLAAMTAVIAAQHAEVEDIHEMEALYPQGWRLADDLLDAEEEQ